MMDTVNLFMNLERTVFTTLLEMARRIKVMNMVLTRWLLIPPESKEVIQRFTLQCPLGIPIKSCRCQRLFPPKRKKEILSPMLIICMTETIENMHTYLSY